MPKEKRSAGTEKTEIWENSKHIRCPDTRSKCAFQPCGQTAHFDFWDAPKPCLIFAKSPWIRGIARELNDIFAMTLFCDKDMKLLKTYRQMLDELQPDMVVTYSIKPNIYMGTACKAKGIPYVANVQGLGTAFEKPVLSSVVSVMYRSALRKAKTVFFENEENAQFFLNKKIIFHRQVRVLPGAGINLDEYPCVPMGDDGVCSFLFVGRIMKEKGVDEFFSAARTLKAEFGEKVAFDVVGFYEDAYKEQVDQLVADGIVRFHGFQTDVHPFYEAADCVVLPSYHEGMSNVLLEGAATGRALITSDIPGCREAVEDGVSGYLCPAQDAEGLTRAMRDFAQQSFDRQVQMGQSGRALAERKFDKQLVVAKTLDGLGLPAAVRN